MTRRGFHTASEADIRSGRVTDVGCGQPPVPLLRLLLEAGRLAGPLPDVHALRQRVLAQLDRVAL